MRAITRIEYLAAVKSASITKNRTAEDILAVCPHLTEEQVRDIVGSSSPREVALPPLRVDDVFQTATYYPASATAPNSFFVIRDGAVSRNRRAAKVESYGVVPLSTYAFVDEAIGYARNHWGDELIEDTWVEYARLSIQDPTMSHPRLPGRLTKYRIMLGLSRSWRGIDGDERKPTVLVLDDAIELISTEPVEFPEIVTDHRGSGYFNCSRCGGGLATKYCTGCQVTIRDDGRRTGRNIPLPPKVIAFLRVRGFTFELDPERLLPVGG